VTNDVGTEGVPGNSKLVKEVLKEDPNNLDVLLLNAVISISNKDYESAIVDLRIVLRDKPDHERAMELLAAAYSGINAKELARETIFNILKINPLNVNAANQYALLHLKEKKYKKAIEILQPLEQAKKLDNQGFTMLMQARLSIKDWSGAEKLAEQNQSKDKSAYKTFIKALTLQGQEKYAESNQLLTALLETDPTLEAPLVTLITNYNLQNDLNTGINYLNNFIEKNSSSNSLAYTLLAKAYLEVKESEKAISTYKKIISQKPDELTSYKVLADIYLSQDKMEEAIAVYHRALKQQPDALIYRYYLAAAYEKLKQNQQAIVQYNMLLEKQPESIVAMNNMASLLGLTGNDEDLAKAYELAKQFENTKNPYFADTLGWIYYLKGDVDKAIVLLKIAVENKSDAAVENKSDAAVFNYHLGKAYMEKNDFKNAKIYIERAIELGGSKEKFAEFDDAQEVLSKIL
jgi:tetratricopeptide (TPR) repeat protein